MAKKRENTTTDVPSEVLCNSVGIASSTSPSVDEGVGELGDADTCQLPHLRPSATNPNFSDDEDDIGAWIWKSSLMARIGSSATTSPLFPVKELKSESLHRTL